MKYIFGLMSLIVIFTVNALNAYPAEKAVFNKQEVFFDASDQVSVAVFETATVFEADFIVNRNIEVKQNNFKMPINFIDLWIDPGLSNESVNIYNNFNKNFNDANSQNRSKNSPNDFYKGLHEPVGWNN